MSNSAIDRATGARYWMDVSEDLFREINRLEKENIHLSAELEEKDKKLAMERARLDWLFEENCGCRFDGAFRADDPRAQIDAAMSEEG